MMIDLGTVTVLVERFGVDPRIAYIPSTGLAVVFVFLANKFFTFRNHEKSYGSQLLKFAFVYGIAIISNLTVSYGLYWLGVHYLLSKVIAIGFGAIWNYAMSHAFVFKKTPVKQEVVVF